MGSARPTPRRRSLVAAGAAVTTAATAVLFLASQASASGDTGSLVANGDFESGLSGWRVLNGTSLVVAPGHTGFGSGRVVNTLPNSMTSVLNDATNTVQNTVARLGYTARAWVRTDAPGTTLALRLMEYRGNTYVGTARKTLWIQDTGWHELDVTYAAQTAGASLDLNVLAYQLPGGKSFDVDDVSLSYVAPQGSSSSSAPSTAFSSAAPTSAAPTTAAPTPAAPTTAAPTSAAPTTAAPSSAAPTSAPPTSAAPTPTPTTVSPTPTQTATAPSGWRLVWGDDFNGSSVDTSKWHVRNNTYSGNELSMLMSRNVTLSNGVMTIAARKETVTVGSTTRQFTSGYLDTIGLHTWTYGRFEMRAKMPLAPGSSKGMWPAFWLRPADGGNGEIDIMEAVGSSDSRQGHTSQTIWRDYGGTPKQAHEDILPSGQNNYDQWHTYAVEWDSHSIRWYIDDRMVFERTDATTSWFHDVFNKPYNIRLNLQVGGSWPGTPDATTAWPQQYQIDYVRVYQH